MKNSAGLTAYFACVRAVPCVRDAVRTVPCVWCRACGAACGAVRAVPYVRCPPCVRCHACGAVRAVPCAVPCVRCRACGAVRAVTCVRCRACGEVRSVPCVQCRSRVGQIRQMESMAGLRMESESGRICGWMGGPSGRKLKMRRQRASKFLLSASLMVRAVPCVRCRA